jgi:hypothetical protein
MELTDGRVAFGAVARPIADQLGLLGWASSLPRSLCTSA